jgi:SET domain-containing protein
MRLLTRFLCIRKSQLLNAGKGLYTKVFIKKNQFVAEYHGPYIRNDHELVENWNPNIIRLQDNLCINGNLCKARRANDADGISRKIGCVNNLRFYIASQSDKVFLIALRDIYPGEELYVGYGPDYWINMCADL